MKPILLIKAKGGLGNRMLALLPPLAWASHHKVGVFIDWRDGMYERRGEDAFFKLFDLKGVDLVEREDLDAAETVAPEIWKGRIDATVFGIAKEVDPLHRDNPPLNKSKIMHRKLAVDLADEPVQGVNIHCAYQDIWRGRAFAKKALGVADAAGRMDFLRTCFDRFILPKQKITSAVEQFVEVESLDRVSIGVHFRNTDRSGQATMHFAAIDRILRRDPDPVVFLATDSEEGLEAFKDRYGDMIRILPKQFGDGGRPIHSSGTDEEKSSRAIEAIRDLWMLRSTDHLIYQGESTFGQLAQAMRSVPHETVFNVSRRKPGYQLRSLFWRLAN